MGTRQSKPIDQTPKAPNEDYEQDHHPLLITPTDQAPYEPSQGFEHDLSYYLPLSTSSNQTPSGPVQSYSQDPFNPPLDQMSDQNRKKCCSCHTFKSIEVEYTNLGDGRYLCPDCLPISLMEPEQLKPIIHQVHSYFKNYLKLPIEKDIPIFFVDENQMREIINDAETVYGMCIKGNYTLKIVKRCVRRGHDIEAVTTTKKVKGRKVAGILLLFGLPKEVLGPTLAHEMVHALIRLQEWGFKLEREVEESLCEAVAYKWFKYIASDSDPAYTEKDVEFAKRLVTYQKQIIKDGSTGSNAAEFLKAKHAIKKYGLKHILKIIGRTRNIPE